MLMVKIFQLADVVFPFVRASMNCKTRYLNDAGTPVVRMRCSYLEFKSI